MTGGNEAIEAALFDLAVDLNRDGTVEGAIDRTVTALRGALGDAEITVWRNRRTPDAGFEGGQPSEEPATPAFCSERRAGRSTRTPPPDATLVRRCVTADAPVRTGGVAGPVTPDDDHRLPREEVFVPIGSDRMLSVGWSHHDAAAASDEAVVGHILERAGIVLAAAIDRIGSRKACGPTGATASKIRLGAFRQAIEDAADGVAVLDDEAYVYVDQTHVEMYGFDGKRQLLGRSWR